MPKASVWNEQKQKDSNQVDHIKMFLELNHIECDVDWTQHLIIKLEHINIERQNQQQEGKKW